MTLKEQIESRLRILRMIGGNKKEIQALEAELGAVTRPDRTSASSPADSALSQRPPE